MAPWVFNFRFGVLRGGIGSVSLGMMWVARCGFRLGDYPGWKDMSPCGTTLGGGAGKSSGVASGVFTIGGGFWEL